MERSQRGSPNLIGAFHRGREGRGKKKAYIKEGLHEGMRERGPASLDKRCQLWYAVGLGLHPGGKEKKRGGRGGKGKISEKLFAGHFICWGLRHPSRKLRRAEIKKATAGSGEKRGKGGSSRKKNLIFLFVGGNGDAGKRAFSPKKKRKRFEQTTAGRKRGPVIGGKKRSSLLERAVGRLNGTKKKGTGNHAHRAVNRWGRRAGFGNATRHTVSGNPYPDRRTSGGKKKGKGWV